MFNKIVFTPSKTITGAAIVIAAAGFLSRTVGLIRDRIFAHYYGAGPIMDAYQAAFKIPDLIFSLLVVGALSAGFIPAFINLLQQKNERARAWQLANNVINVLAITLLFFCAFGVIFAPYLAKLIAPGFNLQSLQLVVTYTRIMFISPFLMGLSMVMGGILQSFKHFFLYALAPVFYNVGIIFGAVVLTNTILGLTGLAWGVVAGAFLHFLLQYYGAWFSGYRWRWYFNLKDSSLIKIGKLMIPRTLALALTQINLIIFTILASFLPSGSIAVFTYANNLQSLPIGIIGIPFAIAAFPTLAALAAQKKIADFSKNIAASTRQIIFLIVPLSIIMLMLRAQVVRVILGTGAFNWSATIATANALAFFSLGMFAQALIPLFARGFFALENTKTPFIVSLIASLVAIIFALLFIKPFGVAGLALAGSIGAVVNFALLYVALRIHAGNLEEYSLLVALLKISIAAIIMALTIQILKEPLNKLLDLQKFWGIFLQGVVAGLVGLLMYGLICRALRLPEMLHLQQSLRKRFIKLWNVGAIDEIETL